MEERKKVKGETECAALAGAYKKKIEAELQGICDDILDMLDNCLIPSTTTAELKVFFYKMKGDYYRYIAEFANSDDKQAATGAAEDAYEEATKLADAKLPSTHPIRLGLALNFSVFYYEIANDPVRACEMARDAFDLAMADLDGVNQHPEDSYRDSTLIMHLLRDNLTLWQTDQERDSKDMEQPAVSFSYICRRLSILLLF